MKLEAKDRLHASLICVATISDIKDDQLLIHFDGWSSKYDYWCKPSSLDIHPIGWCSSSGRDIQPPKGEWVAVHNKHDCVCIRHLVPGMPIISQPMIYVSLALYTHSIAHPTILVLYIHPIMYSNNFSSLSMVQAMYVQLMNSSMHDIVFQKLL